MGCVLSLSILEEYGVCARVCVCVVVQNLGLTLLSLPALECLRFSGLGVIGTDPLRLHVDSAVEGAGF